MIPHGLTKIQGVKMKKLILKVELEVDGDLMYGGCADPVALEWFKHAVLLSPAKGEGLVFHSNCIGDGVGSVKVLEILEGSL